MAEVKLNDICLFVPCGLLSENEKGMEKEQNWHEHARGQEWHVSLPVSSACLRIINTVCTVSLYL